MQLVRLNSSSYQPEGNVIEGYNSLIWTERFQAPGEFELKTYDVDRIADLLPEESFVSHLETKEVFQVETHSIEWEGEGADARPQLTVKGRSVSLILEHRFINGPYRVKRRMRHKLSATTALCVLLWQAVDNNSGYDVTRAGNYSWSKLDDLPNVAVSETVPSEGTLRWWMLEQGMLADQFNQIMIDADLGLRTIRPVYPSPGYVITVETPQVTRGKVNRVYWSDIPQLRFDIYKGVDRTKTVKFSQLQGHLDKPSYLRSIAGHKTVIEILTGKVGISDVYRPGESGLTGWKRRTAAIDFGEPELPEAPVQPDRLRRGATAAQRAEYDAAMAYYYTLRAEYVAAKNNLNADFREEGKLAGLAELKKASKINMVAGDISLLSPYKYKQHYDLGDKVTLLGDRGNPTPMIVQEYVRTEDANGDRGFPGLVVPGEE